MIECKEGDYLKSIYNVTDENDVLGEVENIFFCLRHWQKSPGRRFNRLRLISLESGEEVAFSDEEVEMEDFKILPKTQKEKYDKLLKKRHKELLRKDEKILEKVRESLEYIYPGNWDLSVSENLKNPYSLIIKFPCITIVNGKGDSHEIRDLYVKWEFASGFIMSRSLCGVRGSLSYVEYKSGYFHSHLPQLKLDKSEETLGTHFWREFCLGSGDFAELHSEWTISDRKFIQEDFELLLYQLEAYVKWESLKGGPYIRINSLGVKGGGKTLPHDVRRVELSLIIENLDSFPLRYDNISGRFDIGFLNLEKTLTDLSIPNYVLTKIKKTGAGDYLYGDVTQETIENWISAGNDSFSKRMLFKFRGEEVFIKILELKKNKEDTKLRHVVHPDLTQFTQTELIQKTNNYFIKTYGK